MPSLFAAILVASLAGSPHCAGMCGGLMLYALGADRGQPKGRRVRLQLAYHAGRLVSYLALGAGAGAVGAAVDFGGRFAGVQRAAAVTAGTLMIGFGLIMLARAAGWRTGHFRLPAPIRAAFERAHRFAFTLRPTARALTIGLLTALLPCGWLYAFAFTAAGTASPLWGAAVMGVFWVGTVPLMAVLGTGIQMVTGRLQARLPIVTALAVTGVGAYTALGRLHAPVMSREVLHITDPGAVPTDPDCPLCHPIEP